MEMTQEVYDRIQALEERAVDQARQIEALELAAKQALVGVALAVKPGPAAVALPAAWKRRLEKHGIRLHPEDMDKVQGSGSERWADAGAWTETQGQGLTADTSAAA